MGDQYEIHRFEKYCPTCGQQFLLEKVDQQAARIEAMEKLVMAVKHDEKHCRWQAEWIDGYSWDEYRDKVMGE